MQEELWLYEASYYIKRYPYTDAFESFIIPNEDHPLFGYNTYISLTTGERVFVSDYQKFESIHSVLKMYPILDEKNNSLYYANDYEYYKRIYDVLLKEHNLNSANVLLKDMFSRDLALRNERQNEMNKHLQRELTNE